MKQLSILLSFLVPLANQLAAEEISLICKTKKEFTSVLKPDEYSEVDETRYGSTINVIMGDGIMDDKDFLLLPIYDCEGDIITDGGDAEIKVSCNGLKGYPSSFKEITVNRYSGDIVAVLGLPTIKGGFFRYIYEGNCTKAKQKF